MPLTDAQFDALVARLERRAAGHPAAYKLSLGALAALGYAYVAAILVVLLAAVALLLYALIASRQAALLKLAIPLLLLIGIVLRSLAVRLAAPEGLRLERRDYPELFAAIDELERTTGAPAAHVVLLTNDVNAAVVQVPRLGLLGWQRNYLVLGLPLLQLVSVEEFKAVLAHELGHLSGAHGRFGAWIYRARAGWARLATKLREQQHWGSFLFVPFFDWYAPKFAAYSFVQARRQEYEADQLAARTYGPGPLAAALVRIDLKSRELSDHYWPTVFAAAEQSPTPSTPYRGLLAAERRGFLPSAPEQLRQALERQTSTADTHPCLRDRLAALGLPAAVPPPFSTSAAETLLGARLDPLVERFDSQWQAEVADWWHKRHAHVRDGRAKLAELAARPFDELGDVERYDYALLLEEFDDANKAFEIHKTLVEQGATRGARFAYGRLLLARGDDGGIRLLEDTMAVVPELVLPGCEVIVSYLRSRGRETEAQHWVNRYLVKRQALLDAQRAREIVRTTDTFLPHELPAETLAALQTAVARRTDVKAAYVVRKRTAEGEPPLYVVGVVRKTRPLELESSAADRRLVQELARELRLPGDWFFFSANGKQKRFRTIFKKVPGARIR